MKRKILLLIPVAGLVLTGCTFQDGLDWLNSNVYTPVKDWINGLINPEEHKEAEPKEEEGGEEEQPIEYDLVIDQKVGIESKDEGYLHQLSVNGYTIDLVGYSEEGGVLGSIKKVTYGNQTFNGMIYNRSLAEGLDLISVKFSGGDLHYVFTEFLMEDMSFEANESNKLTSEKPVTVPDGKVYFVIYNKSETPVNVDSFSIKFKDASNYDPKMILDKNSRVGNARSAAKRFELTDSYIEIENNPTQKTNNYSHGHDFSEEHDNAWYRWNGKFLADSENLGNTFSFGVTVMGEYSKIVDESKNFHYAVWPQFGWREDENTLHYTNSTYAMTYIGNDNYEPLGSEAALNPGDAYTKESYTGRFFTDYGWYDDQWKFADPDTNTILDGKTTFREAYDAYNLPFWFIQFDVYLDPENDIACDISINGFKLFTSWIFEDYDKVNTPGLEIHTMPFHVVNYGVDKDATPDASYTGCFTYPRLIED